MNPVIMLTLNNLALTKKAVASVLAQDIEGGVELLIMDNGSTDGTVPWLISRGIHDFSFMSDPSGSRSVASSWNFGLKWFFMRGAEYVLVVNNDIQLRPDTYRHLMLDGGGFVTAVGTDDPGKIKTLSVPDPAKKRPHPDFSSYLIRREVYEKVGPFNEKFSVAYCEDSEYHCRLHAAGITAWCLDLPFLHYGAQTIKQASPADQKRIGRQADKNRELFKSIYGFSVGSKEYYDYFNSSDPASAVNASPETSKSAAQEVSPAGSSATTVVVKTSFQ